MTDADTVAIIPALLPNEGESLRLIYRENPQEDGHKELPKADTGKYVHPSDKFFNAIDIDGLSREHLLISSDFIDEYEYERPVEADSERGYIDTTVHTYLAACLDSQATLNEQKDNYGTTTDPSVFSTDAEINTVEKGIDCIEKNIAGAVGNAVSLEKLGELVMEPAERSWVSIAEIKNYEIPLKHGWELHFEEKTTEPWEETEATYTKEIRKKDARKAIKKANKGGFRIGSHIYCCNPTCTAGNEYKYEGEVLESVLAESPHEPTEKQQQRLDKADSNRDRVPIQQIHVEDGEHLYLLVQPGQSDSGSTPSDMIGWYCSPNCIESVTWPSADCIAIAVEVSVDHPPDIERNNGHIHIDELKGVYRTTPEQQTVEGY